MFGPAVQAAYLDLLRHGVRLGDAAEHLGISRAAPARYARTDPEFATAVEEAKTVGAKVRREGVPHGEYRYNVLGCRCTVCTQAATVARADRRADAASDDTTEADQSPASTAGDVHPIRLETAVVGESSTSFLLARAS
ncbi:excinuclease ATPase subunit A [Streptomyces phage ZL12]|uniref:Excinuclease ATPase subunit A n=1 Tax=Streptomyces phage ZL12 TaxID=2570911 RepID=D0UWC7_9CAUD|nr:excinuclease ATPase subunit A [Streptomyces phage ZL12]ACX71099.1 excinuclease ATPase subunit A [Streptomyces phage ZL12]